MTPGSVSVTMPTSRADLHCHSTASQVSKLGVQRAAGLPECATPPEEVYELAKRRGMDFVTITDHDTIDGVLEIAHLPDVFISEELTVCFAGEPQAVHVLCFGITPDDHEWLQAHSGNVEECAEYLRCNEIACALAHPFYAVAAPLSSPAPAAAGGAVRGLGDPQRLARPGAQPAGRRSSPTPRASAGIGGSDDHAGVDIGRTFTRTLEAADPGEFLQLFRSGAVEPGGEQGSAAKWAHAAIAIAARTLLQRRRPIRRHPPRRRSSVSSSGWSARAAASAREPTATTSPRPTPASLLAAWIEARRGRGAGAALIGLMQEDDFSHRDLFRRARAVHDAPPSRVADAAHRGDRLGQRGTAGRDAALRRLPPRRSPTRRRSHSWRASAPGSHARRRTRPVSRWSSTRSARRTASPTRSSGSASWRSRGFDVEVVGTDRQVDRRLPAVAEVSMPFYEGMDVGIPSLPSLIETLADGDYDLIHIATPGPAGVAAALTARIAGIPLVASHHTEFVDYARMRTGNEGLAAVDGPGDEPALPRVRDRPLAERVRRRLARAPRRPARAGRPLDPRRRHRALLARATLPLPRAEGLRRPLRGQADAGEGNRAARRHLRDRPPTRASPPPGPRRRRARGRIACGSGWAPPPSSSAGSPATSSRAPTPTPTRSCSPRSTDTYGQVVVEAQASGVPVVAVAAGGPADLIEHGRSGLLAEPDADGARRQAGPPDPEPRSPRAPRRRRPRRRPRADVGGDRWTQLADGYTLALGRRGERDSGDRSTRSPERLALYS